MKVLLGTLAKNESKYIKDWILYYGSLGFSKIVFGDNNELGDDSALNELQPFIDSGLVDYLDLRGCYYDQKPVFRFILYKYKLNYDWATFLDLDEYLRIDESKETISEILNQNKFKPFNGIRINWRTFTDNNFVNNPDSLNDYTKFCSKESKNSLRCKILLRLSELTKSQVNSMGVHGLYDPDFLTCNSLGVKCEPTSTMIKTVNWKNIWIDHYKWRSIEDFCDKLLKFNSSKVEHAMQLFDEYFIDNDKTEEKVRYINEKLKEFGIDYEYNM